MKTVFILLSVAIIAITAHTSDAIANACTVQTPCIISAVNAKVRYYDDNINEIEAVKKKAFNKLLPAQGLATDGRTDIDGITLLKIKRPDTGEQVLVEETAFKLNPVLKIDCTGIASAIVGKQDDTSSGVAVGLGNPC